jgi:hypothetical protein
MAPASLRWLAEAYTDMHLGFTAIHPYADGNGRMARLVANVPILRAGQPPHGAGRFLRRPMAGKLRCRGRLPEAARGATAVTQAESSAPTRPRILEKNPRGR